MASNQSANESTQITRDQALLDRVERYVLDCALEIAEMDEAQVQPDVELSDLGFDSVNSVELSGYLNEHYGINVSPTIFYDVHTPRTIAAYLLNEHRAAIEARHGNELPAAFQIEAFATQAAEPARGQDPVCDEPVAIIGMAGLLPGSSDLNEFWTHLLNGDDLISEIPPQRWDWRALENAQDVCRWGGFMPGVENFDAPFFHISPKEAEQMDPQQRLFLQVAWKALEDAGIRPSSLGGSDTAVFVGAGTMDYWELSPWLDGHTATGASHAILANRLSYLLDLRGPSEPVDTACSSSLVALHKAVQAIRHGECGLAVVGGVNAMLTPSLHVALTRAGMLSQDGRCKTFDASANGYVRGEGVAAVILKPLRKALAEGHAIHAVIRSSAVNHGGRAASLTAPSVGAQRQLIEKAWRGAGLDPASADYIEMHGTGTALGDPIEVDALKQAFARLYKDWGHSGSVPASCGIGSVKTNIGHLEAAAGLAGLLKVVLAMRHRTLPASLHCHQLNPHISLEGSPFYIVDRPRPWEPKRDPQGQAAPLRAGISSFGFGGVNVHVVLESPPASMIADDDEMPEAAVCVLSARDPERLTDHAIALADFLRARPAGSAQDDRRYFHDVIHTLQTGRERMKCRMAWVCSDLESLIEGLTAFIDKAPDAAGLYLSDQPSSGVAPQTGPAHDYARRWTQGESCDALPARPARLISLPTYPFARLRFWCDASSGMAASGKTASTRQRAAVPGLTRDASASQRAQAVTDIFREVLGFEEIDPQLSFSEIGADSILAAQIRELIVRRLHVDLSLGRMLDSGSLAGLLELIGKLDPMPLADSQAQTRSPDARELANRILIEPRPLGMQPLSQAQVQFVFLDQLSPANPAFNLPGAVRVCGPFEVARARRAYSRAHQQYEILRTGFHLVEGEAVQHIADHAEAIVDYVDLADMLPTEQNVRLDSVLRDAAQRPFVLEHAPLSRLLIVSLGDEDHVLLLCMHHIIADFSSVALLLNEIALAGIGRETTAPPTAQYADYAYWETRSLPGIVERELPYWRERLADLPGPLPLPFDRPRPSRPSYRGATVSFALDDATTRSLERFAGERRLSIFVVLLAAFNVWLFRLSGRRDNAVGCPYANRLQADTRHTLGPLAYVLIARNRLQDGASFDDVLSTVRDTLYEAFDHLHVPYTRLVEELNPPRTPGCNPLFQVMLNVLSLGEVADEVEPWDVDSGYTDYDLSLRIHTRPHEVRGFLQYSADLFDAETAQALATSFCEVLGHVLADPRCKVDDLRLPLALDHTVRPAQEKRCLHIASTFTDRPLAPALLHWATCIGIAMDVAFAGYNQLFQALYDPASDFFAQGDGYNVIMVRGEDWLRYETGTDPGAQRAIVLDNLLDLADAVREALPRLHRRLMVLILPAHRQPMAEDLTQVYAQFADMLGHHPMLNLYDWRDVAQAYPVDDIFDPLADEAGHVPFSPLYYTALASFISQWIASNEQVAEMAPWHEPLASIHAMVEADPASATQTAHVTYAEPRSELERQLVEAFQAVLGIARVGIDDSFFDLGGHSLSAIRLLHKINGFSETPLAVADIFMAPSVRKLAQRVEAGQRAEVRVDLSRAAVLDAGIRPCLAAMPGTGPRGILLTGATGFVGRFLLRELLDRTEANIYCLARGGSHAEVARRIRDNLQAWDLWRDGDEARITALAGDLTQPRLGLSEPDYLSLARHTDAVYHNATSMNHLESFDSARVANVDGVEALLRLAVSERPKTFNYVSTLGVFSAIDRVGTFVFDETSSIEHEQHLAASGYTSSKWVGEQLVHMAGARGVPCNVFRLGLVTGDAQKGRYDGLQSFHRLLKSCVLMGAAFEGYRYDLVITPVDYVARAMVYLGEKHRDGGGVFHLSSMEVTPMESVFHRYNQLAEPPLEILAHSAWLGRVETLYRSGVMLPIVPLVHALMGQSEDALRKLMEDRKRVTLTYDCSRTQTELEAAGILLPTFDDTLFHTYLSGMIDQDSELQLAGKIVLKTLPSDARLHEAAGQTEGI
jgi:thioester reductase-like protein